MLRRFWSYLLGKRSELDDLGLKDAVLAKVVLDIHRTRTHKERVILPLFQIHKVHQLDRQNALAATRARVDALTGVKQELVQSGTITCDLLARHLPSISWMKVVRSGPEEYLAFEGNGRLEAMQQVFAPADGICVEVEEYRFRRPEKIVRRLQRVRRMNGLSGN